jgi:hypothetical protein
VVGFPANRIHITGDPSASPPGTFGVNSCPAVRVAWHRLAVPAPGDASPPAAGLAPARSSLDPPLLGLLHRGHDANAPRRLPPLLLSPLPLVALAARGSLGWSERTHQRAGGRGRWGAGQLGVDRRAQSRWCRPAKQQNKQPVCIIVRCWWEQGLGSAPRRCLHSKRPIASRPGE